MSPATWYGSGSVPPTSREIFAAKTSTMVFPSVRRSLSTEPAGSRMVPVASRVTVPNSLLIPLSTPASTLFT